MTSSHEGRNGRELVEVTRDEWLAFFKPSKRDRLLRWLVAERCRLLGHRWESETIDHGPGLTERITWCGRCFARPVPVPHVGDAE